MLFAHGYGCDQSMWRFITPAFVDAYRLVLFDQVGAGQSDLSAYSPAKYRSLQGYADDLLEICAALNIVNGVFVGHSVSAMIGVLAAIAEPDRFARLVLIGPSPRYIRTDPAVARQFAAVTFRSDNRADLPRVRVPTLIVQSREDAIAPPVVGEYVHRHLPNSTLEILDAVGHCPHLSAPEQTIVVMKRFLGAHIGAARA
ncbi:MAG: alpha/beta hydrolase [Chloroflexi bacterium]|nr:alpha/beta hydrolase [Chloroflexota bacterium]